MPAVRSDYLTVCREGSGVRLGAGRSSELCAQETAGSTRSDGPGDALRSFVERVAEAREGKASEPDDRADLDALTHDPRRA